LRQKSGELSTEPGPGRIDDGKIEFGRVSDSEGRDGRGHDVPTRPVRPDRARGLRVADGAPARLDGRDLMSGVQKRAREEAGSAEGVERSARGNLAREIPNVLVQPPHQILVRLEERVDRKGIRPAANLDHQPWLSLLADQLLPFHDTNSVQQGSHLGDQARGSGRIAVQKESAEPPLRFRGLEQRHLGHARSARGDGVPNARQQLHCLRR